MRPRIIDFQIMIIAVISLAVIFISFYFGSTVGLEPIFFGKIPSFEQAIAYGYTSTMNVGLFERGFYLLTLAYIVLGVLFARENYLDLKARQLSLGFASVNLKRTLMPNFIISLFCLLMATVWPAPRADATFAGKGYPLLMQIFLLAALLFIIDAIGTVIGRLRVDYEKK